MYADSREPAASTSSTLPGVAWSTERDERHGADKPGAEDRPRQRVPHRHSPNAPRPPAHTSVPTPRRRSATRRSPMPVTRTSLPGGAVVAVTNRWRASRFAGALRSSAARSTPGRHVDVSTVGSANTASSASAGWIDIKSATVTPSRRIQPHVENSDMYMWSSTNTWSRSMASRFR